MKRKELKISETTARKIFGNTNVVGLALKEDGCEE